MEKTYYDKTIWDWYVKRGSRKRSYRNQEAQQKYDWVVCNNNNDFMVQFTTKELRDELWKRLIFPQR